MSNEVALVDQFVKSAQEARDVKLADDVAFELFAASTVLKGHNLSDEEVEDGRIGGGQDGGLDAVYSFLDGRLLSEDAEVFNAETKAQNFRKGAELSLWMIQAKRTRSFREDAFDKVTASSRKFLDLTVDDDQLALNYSPELVAKTRLFTRAWEKLGVRSPRILIKFLYVTRGDDTELSNGVKQKIRDVEADLRKLVPGSDVEVKTVGARSLWAAASATPEYDLQLKFRDYISEGKSFVGLVSLPEYFAFLSDDYGELRGHLFDWNVRDFQGRVAVNRKIRETLESDDDRDFWWLNNGVTILCSNANIGGDKTFTLSNVQIVNGMQTSHAIHDVLRSSGSELDRHRRRSVQVRVITTVDDAIRDDVIRATNSQTKVPDASMHATEDLHRQIEAHFLSKGWFYDRRKNFYKNIGKSADRIIGIPTLGQAVMAAGLSRPDDARARPTTLLNKPADYAQVFDRTTSLDVYLWIAMVQRRVDSLLLAQELSIQASTRTDTRFLIGTYLVTKALGAEVYSPKQLSNLAQTPLELEVSDVRAALDVVLQELEKVADEHGWKYDAASKSRMLARAVIERALA